MKKFKCSEILCKTKFESYSEFNLALCIAVELHRLGYQLDMTDMVITKDITPDEGLEYFKYLISVQAIYIDGIELPDVNNLSTPAFYIDTSCFALLEERGILLKEETVDGNTSLYWSFKWANSTYSDEVRSKLLNISKIKYLLLHLVGYLIVGVHLGRIPKRLLTIEFNAYESKSTPYYVNLVSCLLTLEWLNELLYLKLDLDNLSVDIEYSILCNNGEVAHRNKDWGVDDKRKFLKEADLVEGSIGILWSRKGMCTSNPYGKVINANVVRVEEIGNDFITLSSISINKTKEEMRIDYESIAENKRHLFTDMLYSKPNIKERIYPLYSVGVENYFLSESDFITKIDKHGTVSKVITINGKEGSVTLSQIDAIYWLLCQYEVDFDRKLYKDMYSNGKPLLWDEYGDY